MTEIIFSYDDLYFDGQTVSIHLSSDHRLFIRLADLCDLLGLDWKQHHLYMMTDPYLRDQLFVFNLGGSDAKHVRRRETLFFDLAALSYWLGTLTRRTIRNPKTRERLLGFTRRYATFSWELMNSGFVPARQEMHKRLPIDPLGFSES